MIALVATVSVLWLAAGAVWVAESSAARPNIDQILADQVEVRRRPVAEPVSVA